MSLDESLRLQEGELCQWCRKQPASSDWYFYPAHYFCSLDCKTKWFQSPDDSDGKPVGVATL